MRPQIPLLLASLLAIIPFISATPSPAEPARRDSSPGPSFLPGYTVKNGPTFKKVACYELPALSVPVTPAEGLDKLTIENCITTCYLNDPVGYFKCAGVGAKMCLCGLSPDGRYPQTSDEDCKVNTCAGNNEEYCGSSTNIVLYRNGA